MIAYSKIKFGLVYQSIKRALIRMPEDPSEGAIDTGITGTIEGVIVCLCGDAE